MESLGVNLQNLAVMFPPFMMAVIFHEFAHGLVAYYWGDKTAQEQGRLTLNPIPHVDVMGTLVFPIIAMASGISFLFGWAKPVPIDPRRFRKQRQGLFWVSLAGVGMNFTLALIFAAIYCCMQRWVAEDFYLFSPLSQMSKVAVQLNFALGIFNLIPLPPLDGSKVIQAFLSNKAVAKYESVAPYGFLILLGVLMTPAVKILAIPINFCYVVTMYAMETLFGLPPVF